jgi:hypothetical protein
VFLKEKDKEQNPQRAEKEKEKHLYRSLRFGKLSRFPTAYTPREISSWVFVSVSRYTPATTLKCSADRTGVNRSS